MDIRINSNLVVAHFRLQLFAVYAGNNLVGLLQRHMANHTIAIDFMAQLWKDTATLDLMAGQAIGRERRQVALGRMDVMARGACHRLAGLETPTPFQEMHLAAMNIHVGVRGGNRNVQKFCQHVAWLIGLGGNVREWAAPGMT